MRRLWLILIGCGLLAGVASGQVTQLPDFGKYLWDSGKKHITDKCPLGYSFSLKDLVCVQDTISIFRAPGEFSLATTAVLSCATAACILTFPFDAERVAYADWIMPSFALTAPEQAFLISWRSNATSGSVRWQVESCRYAVTESPCVPSAATAVSVIAPMAAMGGRTDSTFSLSIASTWQPLDHVVIGIRRIGYNPSQDDTLNGDVLFEGFQMEFKTG